MANVSFTRDEVILALDVLYTNGEGKLNDTSASIIELSQWLNRIPVHTEATKHRNFRTPHGVCQQIKLFDKSWQAGEKSVDVGAMFYTVAAEYEDRKHELHSIAKAIKKNILSYGTIAFGSALEEYAFPEGALLGHLHRVIETRDSARLVTDSICSICKIDISKVYANCSSMTSMHLMIPITKIDVKKKYSTNDFITVCPNCHAALHRYRPWLSGDECGLILG